MKAFIDFVHIWSSWIIFGIGDWKIPEISWEFNNNNGILYFCHHIRFRCHIRQPTKFTHGANSRSVPCYCKFDNKFRWKYSAHTKEYKVIGADMTLSNLMMRYFLSTVYTQKTLTTLINVTPMSTKYDTLVMAMKTTHTELARLQINIHHVACYRKPAVQTALEAVACIVISTEKSTYTSSPQCCECCRMWRLRRRWRLV